jgi:hypothetical protein
MHCDHGKCFDDAGMEITKKWNQKEVLEILWVSREMGEVLDDPAKQNDPESPKATNDELRLRVHCSCSLPKESQHQSIGWK